MATGRLGAVAVPSTAYTELYACPADTFAVVSVSLANRTAGPLQVRIAVTTNSASPDNAEFIEYGTTIAANGVLERTGLVVAATQSISVYASNVGISAVAMGIETATV